MESRNENNNQGIELGASGRYVASWADLVGIIAVLFGMFLISGGIGMALKLLDIGSNEFQVAFVYVVYFGGVIFFALMQKKLKVMGKDFTGLLNFKLRSEDLRTVALGVVMVFAVSVLIEPMLSLFPERYFEQMNNAIGRGVWASLVTILFAPVLEEVLFRGFIQDILIAKLRPKWGIIVAAVFFGAFHIIPPQAVNAACVGLILGYIYWKTGSLLPPILIHGANNLIAFLTLLYVDDHSQSTRQMVGDDVLYWLLYVSCVFIAATICMNEFRRNNKMH